MNWKLHRWFYLWAVLMCAIFVASTLRFIPVSFGFIRLLDANRWVHFVLFATAIAIPVSDFQHRHRVLLSIAPALVAILIDFLVPNPYFAALRSQTIPAELFGTAAGILLGLNLRVMRRARAPLKSGAQKPSNSTAL